MIDRLPRGVERTVAATTVLLAGALAVSGCAKEQPPVREAGCFEAILDYENVTIRADLLGELRKNPAIADKDFGDGEGVRGVRAAAQDITETLNNLRKKEGAARDVDTMLSFNDEYAYCVDESGQVTKGPKKLFKTVEQKSRENY